MACVSGTNIVNDGLVFHFDLENGVKSWKGKPTSNLVDDPYFNTSQPFTDYYFNYGFGDNNYQEVSSEPPAIGLGNSAVAIKNTSTFGTFNVRSFNVGTLNEGDKVSLTWNVKGEGGTIGQDVRIWGYNNSADGAISTGLTGLGPLTAEWQKFTYTYTWTKTTPSGGSFTSYIRVDFGNGDRFYVSNPQIEKNEYPTKFVNGIRLDTASIIDLSPTRSTITAANLTYRQDDTPTFDGTDDVISVTDLTEDLDQHSVEICTKHSSTGGIGIYSSYNGDTNRVRIYDYGTYIRVYSGYSLNGPLNFDSGVNSKTSNEWCHVICTFDYTNNSYKIYLNGELKSTDTTALTKPNAFGEINIGCHKDFDFSSPYYYNFYQGEISQVKIYNKALTDAEVRQNFEATRTRYGI